MLVVVYLSDAKQYTVVPEEFIYQLNERNLKNLGLNRNQSRLIYFSGDVFEQLNRNEVFEPPQPNFNLEVSFEYPLPNNLNETCFIGRLIKFEGMCNQKISSYFICNVLDKINSHKCDTDTFEEAMKRANRLRNRLPAVYNPARVFEQPIPPAQLVENEEERNEEINGPVDETEQSIEHVHVPQITPNEHADNVNGELEEGEGEANNHVDLPEESIENVCEPQTNGHLNDNGEEEEQREQLEEVANLSQTDVKPVRLTSSEDLAAFDNLFGCHSASSSATNEVDPLNESHDTDEVTSLEPQAVAVAVSEVIDPLNESENVDASALEHDGNYGDHDKTNEQTEQDERNEQIAANVLDVYLNGQRVVVDEDLEYIHIPDQELHAIVDETYRTKADDVLCGSRPFKETVRNNQFCFHLNTNQLKGKLCLIQSIL